MDNMLPLISQAQAGKRSSYELLIKRFSRLVFARTFMMTRDRHEAEDLTQETFLKAWNKLSSLKEPKQFPSWLLTISRNLALDHLKKKKPELKAHNPNKESSLPSPDHAIYQKEIQNKILDAIETLSVKYQEPIVLRYLEKMSYKQIKEKTGLEESTLKGVLHRGLTELRYKLKPLYNEIQEREVHEGV